MKQIFIDTNVIIDFLADRKPFSDYAAILFQLAKEKKLKIHVSAISFNNTYYILSKVTKPFVLIDLLLEIEEYVGISETNRIVLRQALNSKFKDFEDAIQYYSALQVNDIDFITTRNIKDFKMSKLPVFTPETTVKLLLKENPDW